MTEKEAMDAIEKRPEDFTCHSVGGKLFAPKEQETEFVPIFEGSLEKAIEGIRTFREQVSIEATGMTSFQIKALLEDTVRHMRKVKEYCESTDYDTEVYEYYNSDCFYYELNEIHDMSDEIIKNFKKKIDTDIK